MSAESELALSSAKQVMDEAPFGLHLYRLLSDDRLVFEGANATANKLLQVQHDQFVGKTIEEAFPALVATEVPKKYREVARSGQVWQVDQVDYDEQGIHGAFEVRAVPMSGNHVAVFFTDITERLRTEHSLRDKQKELDNYFTHALDLLCIATLDGRFKRLNPEWERVLGYPVSELEGQNVIDLVHPEDKDRTLEAIRSLKNEHEVLNFVNRYRRRDGAYRFVEWRSFPSNGQIYAIARDVTEHLELLRRTEESEKRYRGLVDAMSELVSLNELVLDDQGKPIDWRTLDVNPAWETALGLSRDKQIGTLASGGYGHTPEHLDEFASVALGGPPMRFDVYDAHYDRTALMSVTSPQHGQFVVVASDISDRVRAEQKLARALQELTLKSQELENLLYVTTHDLRSPLVNIQGFAARIERALAELEAMSGAQPEGPVLNREALVSILGRFRVSLGFITSSTQKMDRLINGLLQLSRLGRKPLQLVTVDMQALWQQVLMVFQHQLREAQIAIQTGELPHCRGDSSQLDQVLSNLLDNAIKYRDPNRPCIVSFSGERRGDGTVLYRLSDTGRGIEPEHSGRIWELFHRLAPHSDVPGDGIGLTAVRQIVVRHGGEVNVESQPGAGSTFWLQLPGPSQKQACP